MGPIWVRRAVVAIVKQNNIARADFFEPPPRTGSGLGIPIVAVDRPHHNLRKACSTGGPEELRATEPEGRPDADRSFPRRPYDGVIAAFKLLDDTPAAEEYKARVRIGVVSDEVIAGRDFRHDAMMLTGIFPQYKKCRRYAIFFEQGQEPGCYARVRAIVERQGASVSRASNDWPE